LEAELTPRETTVIIVQPGEVLETRAIKLEDSWSTHAHACGFCRTGRLGIRAGCSIGQTLREAIGSLLAIVPEVEHVERGALVYYHGSLSAEHGEYRFDGVCACDSTPDYDEVCDEYFPHRFQLVRLDDPTLGLLHVRRRSFTPLE
jgi:hypothetical protein